MEVGERYRVVPEFTAYKDGTAGTRMVGTVVFVHPKGRFAVLEFGSGVREVFYRDQLTEKRLVKSKKHLSYDK